MENLTETYGVVKPNVPPAPMAGHKVVVFEKTGGGMKLDAILNPSDNPYKKKFHLFSPPPSYICYAVTSDTKLNFDFSAEMTLALQHQEFTLKCFVYYHVSDPGAMALAFNTDPIGRIRDEIKKRLQINIQQSKIRFEDIRDDFFGQKDKILPTATLNQLRDFVRAFGVIINEINMTYKIPDKYVAPKRKKEDYSLEQETVSIEENEKRKKAEEEKEKLRHQHELRKIEHGHEKEELKHKHELQALNNEQEKIDTHHTQEMEDVKSFHGTRREMPQLLIKAINKAVDTIDGASSLEKVADSSLGVIDRVTNKLQDFTHINTPPQIPSTSGGVKVLMAENSGPFDEPKELLFKILAKVQNSTIQPEERKALLACITHLLAEIQLEEKANPAMIDQYIKELNKYTVKYAKIFTRSVMEQISELKDTFTGLITPSKNASDIPGNSENSGENSNTPGSTATTDKEIDINPGSKDNPVSPDTVAATGK